MSATAAIAKAKKLTPEQISAAINEFPYEIQLVGLKQLKVDKAYQRPLKPNFVGEMVKDFRPAMIGTLMVSRRKDGYSYIIDGQHRFRALEAKGWAGVHCCVYYDLTRAQEAILFADVQVKRKGVASYERFYAVLGGGDDPRAKEAKGIKASVESVGYTVGQSGSGKFVISAVAALEGCYRKDPDVLERALTIFREAWKDREVPSGWQIRGMHAWLMENLEIDDERMVRRMSIVSATDLSVRASSAKNLRGHGSSSTKDMVAALKAIYAAREPKVTS